MIGRVFELIARRRRARALHPEGTVRAATLTVHAGPLPAGEHPAIVRLSRGLGLPDALPEVVGLAIRLPGLDQDLLLSGLGRDPRTHRYTSLFPFEAGGATFRYNAVPTASGFALTIGGERVAELVLGREMPAEEPRFDVWRHTGGGIRPAGLLNRLRRSAYPGSRRGWPTASR